MRASGRDAGEDSVANFEELSRRPRGAGTVGKANFSRWDVVAPNRRMSIWFGVREQCLVGDLGRTEGV